MVLNSILQVPGSRFEPGTCKMDHSSYTSSNCGRLRVFGEAEWTGEVAVRPSLTYCPGNRVGWMSIWKGM